MFRSVYQITILKHKPKSVFTEHKNNGDSALDEILTHHCLPAPSQKVLAINLCSLQVWKTPTPQKLEEISVRGLLSFANTMTHFLG